MSQLGKETVPANEGKYTKEIVDLLKIKVKQEYPDPVDSKRFFHPKMHGCVKAVLKVEDDLPETLQNGIFQPGKEYQCWIRFSNAKRKVSPDEKADIRGVAIKVMNVEGTPLTPFIDPNINNQDFIVASHDVFNTKDVKATLDGFKAITGSKIGLVWYALTHLRTIFRSMKLPKKTANVLEVEYFSMIPYLYGNQAVKYNLKPQPQDHSTLPAHPTFDFLRERMVETLLKHDVKFDFRVQFQCDAKKQPVENPTVLWTTPFIKLATLTVLKQEFDSEEQRQFGTSLTFEPWHCIEPHRPIGGISRARRPVYNELSKNRHERTGRPITEPDSWELSDDEHAYDPNDPQTHGTGNA